MNRKTANFGDGQREELIFENSEGATVVALPGRGDALSVLRALTKINIGFSEILEVCLEIGSAIKMGQIDICLLPDDTRLDEVARTPCVLVFTESTGKKRQYVSCEGSALTLLEDGDVIHYLIPFDNLTIFGSEDDIWRVLHRLDQMSDFAFTGVMEAIITNAAYDGSVAEVHFDEIG